MLSFLSSLFSSQAKSPGGPDESLVDAAIERVVDATDPRLRAFPGYRKRLYEGARRSVAHVEEVVGSLPAPVEISRRSFSTDPRLRAFFASPERMQQAVASAPSMVEFLADRKGPFPDYIFGLLAPEMRERKTLGMELKGDLVRRDVLQEVVDFSDHRFLGAAGSEEEARDGLKKRAFDYLAELALRRIVDVEEKRSELERKKGLLKRKLDTLRGGNWGLEVMPAGGANDHPDYRSLSEQIAEVDDELMALPCNEASLENRFGCINAILEQPEEWLSLNRFDLHVDVMSLKMTTPDDEGSKALELTRFRALNGGTRVALFGYFPRAELPPEKDFFKEAGRLLGG